jgi:capsid protein
MFADRRDYRKATIKAAQTAASIAAVMENQATADVDAEDEVIIEDIPWDTMFNLPKGYKLGQVRSEHPNNTYENFSRETLNEATRCRNVALNVAKGDSGGYNMASGRLDIMLMYCDIGENQLLNTEKVVEPLFKAWYAQARIRYEWTSRDGGKAPKHTFLWPGQPYSDPDKEQKADEEAVSTGMRGMHEIWARRGKDWDVEAERCARSLGMKKEEYIAWVRQNLQGKQGGLPGAQPGEDKNQKSNQDQNQKQNGKSRVNGKVPVASE